MDDGSTDDFASKISPLKKEKNLQIVTNDTNQGRSVARNKAIDQVQTEYLYFLDSDDMLINNWPFLMEKGISLFTSAQSQLISTVTFNLNNKGSSCTRFSGLYHYSDMAVQHRKFLCTSSNALHRTKYLKGLAFDPELSLAEDVKFWMQLEGNGYCFYHIPETIARYSPCIANNIDTFKMLQCYTHIIPATLQQQQLIYNLSINAMMQSRLRYSVCKSRLLSMAWFLWRCLQ